MREWKVGIVLYRQPTVYKTFVCCFLLLAYKICARLSLAMQWLFWLCLHSIICLRKYEYDLHEFRCTVIRTTSAVVWSSWLPRAHLCCLHSAVGRTWQMRLSTHRPPTPRLVSMLGRVPIRKHADYCIQLSSPAAFPLWPDTLSVWVTHASASSTPALCSLYEVPQPQLHHSVHNWAQFEMFTRLY